ncbi:hypothetical protein HanXRQr2_Chr09g0375331 [Helianthus annuus]|uniref:Uncharacterized protein n=1 Tax=Helianthus annuus TaxID=4232 RepID=A0A9K3N7L6_HELAN|nr:hypothetical protein HanXRQr2_Chr09g0375331 [Helianthus annuus]KAJ0892099.1 hypothetical protein HanPSC8_Chr09g0361831 [Helianthus annuus]
MIPYYLTKPAKLGCPFVLFAELESTMRGVLHTTINLELFLKISRTVL